MSARKRTKPNGSIPEALTDKSRGPRLQKVLAGLGVGSRRACETMISDGHVRVNGQAVTAMPAFVDPDNDRIEVDGKLVSVLKRRPGKSKAKSRGQQVGKVYIAVHKPRNVISTTSDPQGRRTVMDLVKLPGLPKRMYPVGRLDADSTGLILLTNDGDLANHLTHPRYEVTKQYDVSIKGSLTDQDIKRLREGLYLASRSSKARKASTSRDRKGAGTARQSGKQSVPQGAATVREQTPQREGAKKARMSQVRRIGYEHDRARGDRTNLLITLREGQNREIRRMLARLGFKVRRLKRISVGPIKLKGLGPGRWRLLTTAEVNRLKKASKL